MPEFTGERVVPGLVDADLYNEHVARYEFAARFVEGRRVLDAGCGSGYGAMALAGQAASVTAIDLSSEAITFASEMFIAPNLEFQLGSCYSLPAGSFDVIVAFEVIEHLADWRLFIQEARRVLAPGGRFFVSTPNKTYYAESRGEAGSNPFHVHEFEYEEFHAELASVFSHVDMFLQNHVGGVAFTPLDSRGLHCKAGYLTVAPEEAHFFLALCGTGTLPAEDAFLWVPGTGNLLREREHHIGLLSKEIALKNAEMAIRNREYEGLLRTYRDAHRQMEERSQWAIQAREESEERGKRISELQGELAQNQANFAEIAAKYQTKVEELEATNRAKTEWALETERRLTQELTDRSTELGRCVQFLDRAEQTVNERTHWAHALQHELDYLKTQAAAFRAGRWVRVGTKFGFVPQ